MPAGGFRPQLVSPPTVGADEVGAEAELETTAALGNGAAVCVAGAGSEPPPQAAKSVNRLSEESRAAKCLVFLARTKLDLKVECINKLSAGASTSRAVGCNQTKAGV